MSKLNKLIVILGPTASGKSEMALKLAKKYDGEIINADSRQIYKKMIIGTGSPTSESQKSHAYRQAGKIKSQNDNAKVKNMLLRHFAIENVPNYLFHFVSPKKQYSVAEYKRSAIKIIRDIHERNKLPILVGGTGLYISSIVDNFEIPKAPPSNKIRASLEKETATELFNMLAKIDPNSAAVIGPNNKRKLIRAIEVYKITGKPFSSLKMKGEPLFNVLQIAVKYDRNKLYKKIDRRVDGMIKNGLIEETKYLLKKYSHKLPAMTGIGYKEIGRYLSGELPLSEAAQRIKFRTHQYARRQMTWFKRDERIRWVKNQNDAMKIMKRFLDNSLK